MRPIRFGAIVSIVHHVDESQYDIDPTLQDITDTTQAIQCRATKQTLLKAAQRQGIVKTSIDQKSRIDVVAFSQPQK
jgi:hypothetical protein